MAAKRSPFDYRQIAGFYFSASSHMSGDLNETEDIVVDGQYDGNITTTGFCEITENGIVKGNIIARNATILGVTHGEIKVQENCVVKKSASITGYIITPHITIESGATVNARIKQPSAGYRRSPDE